MIRNACIALTCLGTFFNCCTAKLAAQDKEQPVAEQPDLKQLEALFNAVLGLSRPAPEPEWHPLESKAQDWVDAVLAYWEERAKKLKTLECAVQFWEFEASANSNRSSPLTPTKYSKGIWRYAAPDKGLFKLTDSQVVIPSATDSEKPSYRSSPESNIHWQTDGERVIQFDSLLKEVIEVKLAPEQRDRILERGPFPLAGFLRIDAKTLKTRYWIRPLLDDTGYYCLEAVPKSPSVVKRLQIVIDEKQFLPCKMQQWESDWFSGNERRTVYTFENRIENGKLNLREFSVWKTPDGWKHRVVDLTK